MQHPLLGGGGGEKRGRFSYKGTEPPPFSSASKLWAVGGNNHYHQLDEDEGVDYPYNPSRGQIQPSADGQRDEAAQRKFISERLQWLQENLNEFERAAASGVPLKAVLAPARLDVLSTVVRMLKVDIVEYGRVANGSRNQALLDQYGSFLSSLKSSLSRLEALSLNVSEPMLERWIHDAAALTTFPAEETFPGEKSILYSGGPAADPPAVFVPVHITQRLLAGEQGGGVPDQRKSESAAGSPRAAPGGSPRLSGSSRSPDASPRAARSPRVRSAAGEPLLRKGGGGTNDALVATYADESISQEEDEEQLKFFKSIFSDIVNLQRVTEELNKMTHDAAPDLEQLEQATYTTRVNVESTKRELEAAASTVKRLRTTKLKLGVLGVSGLVLIFLVLGMELRI